MVGVVNGRARDKRSFDDDGVTLLCIGDKDKVIVFGRLSHCGSSAAFIKNDCEHSRIATQQKFLDGFVTSRRAQERFSRCNSSLSRLRRVPLSRRRRQFRVGAGPSENHEKRRK
jgi:hypothetical protein